MNTKTQPRRAATGLDATAGVRPGAGVFGLARSEAAAKATPEEDPTPEGTLIVGEGIYVKGEIESCTTLIVEGRVEASLEASVLNVRRGGLYCGKATVKSASVDGRVEGNLTVNGLLTVESGGYVSGTLRYRELKIEQGGRLSGDIDLLPERSGRKAEVEPSAPVAEPEPRMVEGALARR